MGKTLGRLLAILCAGALLGLLAAMQLKNVSLAGGVVSPDRSAALEKQMDELREQKAELAGRLASMQAELDGLKADQAQGEAALQDLGNSIAQARQDAGLTDVTGPGILLTINPRTYEENGRTRIIKDITDTELLSLVNELYAAGAEAISINGHRLVAQSAIRLAGDHININHVATDMPYEVKAIGDPQTLQTALELYGGVLESFEEFYTVKTVRQDALAVGAYEGTMNYRYAQPVAQP